MVRINIKLFALEPILLKFNYLNIVPA